MGGLRRKKADTEGSMALFCAANAGHEEVVAFLLSQGAQASCRDGIGKTPLMWACEEDHMGVVRVLVQHMGTHGLQLTDEQGRTAIHWAAYWGHEDMVAFLLDKGAQANSSDRARKTPFMMACEAGHVGVAGVLLPYIGDGGLKDTDEQERSALHLAALGGHKDTVTFLLSKGAQADRRVAMGKTPLEWACDKGHVDVVWVLAHHMAAQGREEPDAQAGTALLWAVRAGHEKVVALLLGAGAPSNSKGKSGTTPLMVACEEGHLGVVRALLRHTGTEGLQGRDEKGWTTLHYAAVAGHAEVSKCLLTKGALANIRDGEGRTPLILASWKDHLGVVQVLADHVGAKGLQDIDEQGSTALHWAAYWGHEEVAALLLCHGAQANSTEKDGRTPLLLACEKGHVGVVRVLMEHSEGQALFEPDRQGRTPLQLAAYWGHEEVVNLLLSNGDQVNVKDPDGTTALLWACEEGHLGVVRVLVEHLGKRALRQTDEEGRTALHLAAYWGHAGAVTFLLTKGAPAFTKDSFGCTAFLLACCKGHLDVVRVLLHHMGGEALLETDGQGITALHWASHGGHEEVVAFLVKAGMQANSKCALGKTPLMTACEMGHLGVVRMLVRHTGRTLSPLRSVPRERFTSRMRRGLEEADNKGWTALHWAAEGCHEEVMAFLLSKGAQANNRPGADTTILMWACKKRCVVVARALLKHVVITALQETDAQGWTPLHYFACWGHQELVGPLLNQGAQANSRDVLCRTPLMLACEKGQVDVVRLLLQHTWGQGLHDVDKQGRTALELAALGGHDETVAFLVLDKTAQAHSKDTRGRTPLMVACRKGQVNVVRAVVQHLGVEALQETDEKGWTALHWAAEGNNQEIISLLLGRGADANSRGSTGGTPFMIACWKSQLGVVRLLLEHTGEQGLEARDKNRLTPLHYAAYGGQKEIVVFLLLKGAEPNSRDHRGKVPLLWACMHGRLGAVQVFIQHMGTQGLQVSDRGGMTALHRAAEGGHEEVVAFLLGEGAQANSRGLYGRMPLLSACEKGHLSVVRLLVQHMGIQGVEETGERGWTALHSAAKGGHEEMVAFLTSTGARTNSRDDYAMTPLDWACEKGHVGVVRVLLKYMGAQVLSETHGGGTTALHWAVGKGHDVIVRLLLLAGADPRMTDYQGRTPRALAEEEEGRAGCVAVFEVSGRICEHAFRIIHAYTCVIYT
jgi:ankyrin repeat protein